MHRRAGGDGAVFEVKGVDRDGQHHNALPHRLNRMGTVLNNKREREGAYRQHRRDDPVKAESAAFSYGRFGVNSGVSHFSPPELNCYHTRGVLNERKDRQRKVLF